MATVKEQVKELLNIIGCEEPAHTLWSYRPNYRGLCRNAGFRLAGDDLPIPPTSLICLVTTSRDISRFLHGGVLCRESILYALRRNCIKLEDFKAILDFGCGCGRIMRHWRSLEGPHFYGSDYNPDLIHWCQRKLCELAEFKTNQLQPPLDYKNEQFDFIYSISVFTHLTEDLQHGWMKELGRVLNQGGYLLITVHGDSRLYQLSAADQRRFRSGQLVVIQEDCAGQNVCGAYHPEQYVRNHLTRGYEVVDSVQGGARDSGQDIYLLKKPALN